MEKNPDSKAEIKLIIELLKKNTKGMITPAALQIMQRYGRNPFLILISCILSLRTKDTVSLPASIRLFDYALTPKSMLLLDQPSIEKLIFPVGFYKRKASQIHLICTQLINDFQSTVPGTRELLLSLPGVGPKTANLTLGIGFGTPALCVDIHVHRISNRLGIVKTKTPEETEAALTKIIPEENWIAWNELLVMWGQNVCLPRSPRCSNCPLSPFCPKIGLIKN